MIGKSEFIGNRPTQYGRWIQAGYVVTDLLLVVGNSCIVFLLRFGVDWGYLLKTAPARRRLDYPPLGHYLGFLIVWALLIVVMCQEQDLYRTSRTQSTVGEMLAVTRAVSFATILLTVFIYLTKLQGISRVFLGVTALLNLGALEMWRYWKRQLIIRRVVEGHGVRSVLIVGNGDLGNELAAQLERNKHYGFVVKGFWDPNDSNDLNTLGTIAEFSEVVRSQFIDEVFITIPGERSTVKEIVSMARQLRLDVKVVPDLYDGLSMRAPVEYLGDIPVMSLHSESVPVLGLFVKRTMDIILSVVGLIFVAPVMGLIAVAIKVDSRGRIFYRSPRVGKKGRQFTCYKFRTMVSNAARLKEDLRHLNERQGPFFKISNDPRITRVGKFLRQWSLDEIPQLINVFKGDMSLVGPRPHPLDDFALYTLDHRRRLDVSPGVTGPWQVSARQDPSFEKSMMLDLEYIEHWGPWLDIKILFKTVSAVLKGGGV